MHADDAPALAYVLSMSLFVPGDCVTNKANMVNSLLSLAVADLIHTLFR